MVFTHATTTNTTKNTYVNMPCIKDLTKEYIQQQVEEHYTRQYFTMGQKGVARFSYDKLLKDRDGNLYLECSDPSRHIFRFKDEYGNIIRDMNAKHLTQIIAEPVNLKSTELLEEIKEDTPWMAEHAESISRQIQQLTRDNSEMCRELGSLTTSIIV